MSVEVSFDDQPAPLPALLVGVPLIFLGLSLLALGIPSGAEPWIVLGVFSSGVGAGCLFQRGCAIAGFGAFTLAMASFITFYQIVPQYHTSSLLKKLDSKARVALNDKPLEPEMEERIVQALRLASWDPGLEAKGRGDSWRDGPTLSVGTDPEIVQLQIGLMGETPVVRRGHNEGMNSGIIRCKELYEPLAELGWETEEGDWGRQRWVTPGRARRRSQLGGDTGNTKTER